MVSERIKEKVVRERLLYKKTVAEVVEKFGVSAGSVSRWTRDFINNHNIEELQIDDNELTRLRREVKRLSGEVDRLTCEKEMLQDLFLQLYEKNDSIM
jgi:transposase-like protein